MGVPPEYFEAREWGLQNGRIFPAEDFRSNSKVVLLGNTVAQNISPGQDLTGSVIRIHRVPFKVAGLLEAKGYSLGGWDQTTWCSFPWPRPGKRSWEKGR